MNIEEALAYLESFALSGYCGVREAAKAVRAEVERLSAEVNRLESRTEGHGQPCYYCGERCNSLSAHPSKWPVGLCHADEPGVVKWHHEACLNDRLAEAERLEAIVDNIPTFRDGVTMTTESRPWYRHPKGRVYEFKEYDFLDLGKALSCYDAANECHWIVAADCYSTREAAEAKKGQ